MLESLVGNAVGIAILCWAVNAFCSMLEKAEKNPRRRSWDSDDEGFPRGRP